MSKNSLEVVISILIVIFVLIYFGSLSSELVSVKRKLKMKEEEIRLINRVNVKDSIDIDLDNNE